MADSVLVQRWSEEGGRLPEICLGDYAACLPSDIGALKCSVIGRVQGGAVYLVLLRVVQYITVQCCKAQ